MKVISIATLKKRGTVLIKPHLLHESQHKHRNLSTNMLRTSFKFVLKQIIPTPYQNKCLGNDGKYLIHIGTRQCIMNKDHNVGQNKKKIEFGFS